MFELAAPVEIGYDERHAALVRYLQIKVQECNWRAVSDAANDLRVLEASRLAEDLRDTEGKQP